MILWGQRGQEEGSHQAPLEIGSPRGLQVRWRKRATCLPQNAGMGGLSGSEPTCPQPKRPSGVGSGGPWRRELAQPGPQPTQPWRRELISRLSPRPLPLLLSSPSSLLPSLPPSHNEPVPGAVPRRVPSPWRHKEGHVKGTCPRQNPNVLSSSLLQGPGEWSWPCTSSVLRRTGSPQGAGRGPALRPTEGGEMHSEAGKCPPDLA